MLQQEKGQRCSELTSVGSGVDAAQSTVQLGCVWQYSCAAIAAAAAPAASSAQHRGEADFIRLPVVQRPLAAGNVPKVAPPTLPLSECARNRRLCYLRRLCRLRCLLLQGARLLLRGAPNCLCRLSIVGSGTV